MNENEPRRGGKWLLLIGVLLLAGIGIVVGIGMHNMRYRLKPEDVVAARIRWDQEGPKNYSMVYTTLLPHHSTPDRFEVNVVNGVASEGTINGQPLPLNSLKSAYGMHKLLDFIEGLESTKPDKSKNDFFSRATFDRRTGALEWYSRRELGGDWSVEIRVESLKSN